MTIFDVKRITQKDVDELNELLVQPDFDTLKKAARKILGDEVSAAEVRRKSDNLRKRLNNLNYYYNKETKIYEYLGDKKEENTKWISVNPESEKTKNENKKNKIDEIKNKKPRRTKAQIQEEELKKKFEEEIKINPLMLYSKTGHEITDKLFYSSADECTGTGVYLLPTIVDGFKAVEDTFSHIYNYRLVDAAIQLTHEKRAYLMESSVFMDFMRILNKDKLDLKKEEARRKKILAEYEESKKRDKKDKDDENKKPKFPPLKKQLNLKLSETAVKNLNDICKDFSMFNKSEVINLCMFTLSECAKITFLKNK